MHKTDSRSPSTSFLQAFVQQTVRAGCLHKWPLQRLQRHSPADKSDFLYQRSQTNLPIDQEIPWARIKKLRSSCQQGIKTWNLQGAGGEFPYQYVVQFFQDGNSTSSTSSEPKHRSWSLDLIAWIENLSVWYFAKRLSKQRPEAAFNLSWFVHCSFMFSLYPVLPRPAHVPWANVLTPSRNGTSETAAASKAWFLFLRMVLHESHLTCVSSRLASWRVKWLKPFAWTPMVSIKQIPSRWKIRLHKFGFPSGVFGFPELN